jgi:excisionase family DNA binding protein
MITGKKSTERLMTLPELSEMLGVPIDTLYGWRHRGEGPVGYRIGRHVRYRRAAAEEWLEMQLTVATRWVGGTVAYIERR